MKVITVHDTPPYGHASTYQISLTDLERQKCYGPDKKILFKKQLFDWEEAEEAEEAEEKIRLKQYVSLRSKGKHKNDKAHFIIVTNMTILTTLNRCFKIHF